MDVEELLAGEEWDSQELPILTPGMVKEASRKFKDRTALGQCGWHPKVLCQLPESGLEATAELLMLIEEARRWPGGSCCVDLVRLVKEGGGHRLIGLLPALYRVWGKIRRGVCDEWEMRNKDSCDFAVAGQSAQRASWDFAIENEA